MPGLGSQVETGRPNNETHVDVRRVRKEEQHGAVVTRTRLKSLLALEVPIFAAVAVQPVCYQL